MLVSRTKPCMPQNNCTAGICAWLITSDAICRKNVAVSLNWIPCAKRQANTWIKGLIPQNRWRACLDPGGWPCGWMKVKLNASQEAVSPSSAESIHLCVSWPSQRLLTNNCPISQWWPCSGLPWRWRERGIRVRFRRGSLRNGYHFYGGQQARKLPNAKTNDEAAKRNRCPKLLVGLGLSMGDI